MTDINVNEIRKITEAANYIGNYLELNYCYLEEYEKFNIKIFEATQKGEKSILFDFVDSKIDKMLTLKEIIFSSRRIYLSSKGGHAINNMFDYPLYLISRGFKVDIMDAQKRHGYYSKSYMISW